MASNSHCIDCPTGDSTLGGWTKMGFIFALVGTVLATAHNLIG